LEEQLKQSEEHGPGPCKMLTHVIPRRNLPTLSVEVH
jgi:hypothetical protein